MTTSTKRANTNGVDLGAMDQMSARMRENPGTGLLQFRSSSTWKGGAVTETTFAGYKQDGLDMARPIPHKLGADEPPALLGTGTQPGPAGHLIHALTHSFAATMAYHGARRGVEINSMKIDAEGKLDLQGMLALNQAVRPGFKQINLTVWVDSPNTTDEVRDLFQYAQGRSPIVATLSQPVDVDWKYEIEPARPRPEKDGMRHGVNMQNLMNTVGAIQQNPVLGKCKFYTSAEWLGGMKVRSDSPGFDQAEGDQLIRHWDPEPRGYTGDEPQSLLGTDAGPSSCEALLKAMASCVTVTTSYHAAARGMSLDAFDVDFEGDLDLRGLTDMDDAVTPGYKKIRARVCIKAGAPKEDIDEFVKFATAHSPMCNTVMKPVTVTFSLMHNGRAAAGSAVE